MGKSRNNKHDKNAFLLKNTLIFILSVLLIGILIAENRLYDVNVQPFLSLIEEKMTMLDGKYPGIPLSLKYKESTLSIQYNEHEIDSIRYDTLNRGSIVSLFMNLDLILSMRKALTTDGIYQLHSEALFEYPFVDDTGTYFLYISDKTFGNRNPFILNLNTLQETEIIIPESSEYFPVYLDGKVYFLSGQREYMSLMCYSPENGKVKEIGNGQISCLRVFNNSLYYCDYDRIVKINKEGFVEKEYLFDNYIQSFVVTEHHLFLSKLEGHQYDIFKGSMKDDSLINLTSSKYNEMDLNTYDSNEILFSSNDSGKFNLYTIDFEGEKKDILFSDDKFEHFYPFYSDHYGKIVVATFDRDSEPVFSFLF